MFSNIIQPTLPLQDYSEELSKLITLLNPQVDFYWENSNPIFSNNTFLLGGCYGLLRGWQFLPDLDCALNELAHFIETPIERLFLPNYGIKYGTTYNKGTRYEYFEFSSSQHIQREIRVWAIQFHLYNYLQLDWKEITNSELIKTAERLDGFSWKYKFKDFWQELYQQVHLFTWDYILNQLTLKRNLINNV